MKRSKNFDKILTDLSNTIKYTEWCRYSRIVKAFYNPNNKNKKYNYVRISKCICKKEISNIFNDVLINGILDGANLEFDATDLNLDGVYSNSSFMCRITLLLGLYAFAIGYRAHNRELILDISKFFSIYIDRNMGISDICLMDTMKYFKFIIEHNNYINETSKCMKDVCTNILDKSKYITDSQKLYLTLLYNTSSI